MVNVTINSAAQVAMAAPSFDKIGISSILRVKFTNAPAIVHLITIFSFPCGYNICIPRTFDSAINNNIGDNICNVKTAGVYEGPQNNFIKVGDVTNNPKNNGKLNATT